jgi:hypothetical protein
LHRLPERAVVALAFLSMAGVGCGAAPDRKAVASDTSPDAGSPGMATVLGDPGGFLVDGPPSAPSGPCGAVTQMRGRPS